MKLPAHEDWMNEKFVETVMKAKGVERDRAVAFLEEKFRGEIPLHGRCSEKRGKRQGNRRSRDAFDASGVLRACVFERT